MRRPQPGEFADYYQQYIDLTRGANYIHNLSDSADQLIHYLENLPVEKWDYAYAPEKWTVRQLVQHIIDCDLVFIYRALWMIRTGGGTLEGFDENQWAENSQLYLNSTLELIEQFRDLRNYIIGSLRHLTDDKLNIQGNMSGKEVMVNSIPFIIAGHTFHHLNILRERYQ